MRRDEREAGAPSPAQGLVPIEVRVAGRPALVVGGDAECASKVERLLEADAIVTVVTHREVDPSIVAHAAAGRLALHRRAFVDGDAEDAVIIFVSTDEERVGEALYQRALASGRLVCCLDRPARSTFVNPSVFSVSGLRVSLSSGGKSPGLLRQLRRDLALVLGDPRLGRFVAVLAELRGRLPSAERAARLRGALRGFKLRGNLEFPEWFEAGGEPGDV